MGCYVFWPGPGGLWGPPGSPPEPSVGLPGASRRPPGPKTDQSKKPRNLKVMIEQWRLYLRAKQNQNSNCFPGSGPKPRLLKENDSPDPPSGPPGEGGDKKQIKSVLKYSWAPGTIRFRIILGVLRLVMVRLTCQGPLISGPPAMTRHHPGTNPDPSGTNPAPTRN